MKHDVEGRVTAAAAAAEACVSREKQREATGLLRFHEGVCIAAERFMKSTQSQHIPLAEQITHRAHEN